MLRKENKEKGIGPEEEERVREDQERLYKEKGKAGEKKKV